MIVRELIEILETYDPEFTVVVETIVNEVDIDHVKPGIAFNLSIPGVVIYPEDQQDVIAMAA